VKRTFKVPLDVDGVRLKEGDPVVSTSGYDGPIRHEGKVVGVEGGLVSVQHIEGCCDGPSNRTWRSAAFLWKRAV
jgi:hypothetical protein